MHMPPQQGRLPWPGWPWWIAAGVVVIPLVLISLVAGSQLRAAHDEVGRQQKLLGVSAVVSGSYVDADTSSGMPKATGHYRVTVPDSAPAEIAGSSQTVDCGTHFGLPPSTEFPSEQDQLIRWTPDGKVYSAECGAPGTVKAVTNETLRAAQGAVPAAEAGNIGSVIAAILLPTGLAATALVLSIRRAQAKRGRIG